MATLRALSFSLFLLLATIGFSATPLEQMRETKTLADARKVAAQLFPDDRMAKILKSKHLTREDLVQEARMREIAGQGSDYFDAATAKKQAAAMVEEKNAKDANWLAKAGTAAGRIIEALLRRPMQKTPNFPNAAPALGAAIPFLEIVVYVALGLLLLFFLVLALRHVSFKGRRGKKRTAMVDDDEPERTLDEWLDLAAKYQASGEYRMAVRALYVGCLLRLDQLEVIRFIRGQTNWEHLYRFERSPKRLDLDLRAATKMFDRIWYGMETAEIDDVAWMRAFYESIRDANMQEAS
ncbi:MAG: DUF4129 domain-containing protein [Armatimonadetes bacterium]|nr:DUF4129 domain-containing protein [Armatimonadota bacterium]